MSTSIEDLLADVVRQLLSGRDADMDRGKAIEMLSRMSDEDVGKGIVAMLAFAVSIVKAPKETVVDIMKSIVGEIRDAERLKVERERRGKQVAEGVAEALK